MLISALHITARTLMAKSSAVALLTTTPITQSLQSALLAPPSSNNLITINRHLSQSPIIRQQMCCAALIPLASIRVLNGSCQLLPGVVLDKAIGALGGKPNAPSLTLLQDNWLALGKLEDLLLLVH